MYTKGTWNLGGIVIIFVSTVLLLSLVGLFVPIISRSQLSYFPPSQRQVQRQQQQSSGNQVSIINSITGNESKVIIEPKISIPYSLAVTKIIGYKHNLSNSVRNGIYSNKVVILNFYDDINYFGGCQMHHYLLYIDSNRLPKPNCLDSLWIVSF